MNASKFVNEDVIKTATRVIEKNVKEGWMVNPNPKVVAGIFKSLIRCNGECPCDNHSAEKECPCSGYRLEDHCCCQLYVKQD